MQRRGNSSTVIPTIEVDRTIRRTRFADALDGEAHEPSVGQRTAGRAVTEEEGGGV